MIVSLLPPCCSGLPMAPTPPAHAASTRVSCSQVRVALASWCQHIHNWHGLPAWACWFLGRTAGAARRTIHMLLCHCPSKPTGGLMNGEALRFTCCNRRAHQIANGVRDGNGCTSAFHCGGRSAWQRHNTVSRHSMLSRRAGSTAVPCNLLLPLLLCNHSCPWCCCIAPAGAAAVARLRPTNPPPAPARLQ